MLVVKIYNYIFNHYWYLLTSVIKKSNSNVAETGEMEIKIVEKEKEKIKCKKIYSKF